MDFYNKVSHEYLNIINRPITHWKIRMELLDHYENTIGAIERDIDNGNSGSITCNYEQGTRKSCTITLSNIDEKYTPDENNPFWFNRKFRLYIGLTDDRKVDKRIEDFYWAGAQRLFDGDMYWFAKGVYITQNIKCDSVNHIVTISGVDKYAQLDGTLNVLQADEMDTVFRYGSNVRRVVSDILMLDMGNRLPLDPIEPIIDTDIAKEYLYKEFTLSAGQYYGDFLNELASSFGCEVFYDNLGRFTMRRAFTDDVAYWNAFKAPSHEFKYGVQGYMDPQEDVDLNGVNKIIVQTENIETPNASYVAINHNPRSPLCYDKIGARTLPENGGIVTINAGDIEQDNRTAEYMVMKRCKEYAEYRLMKETCTAIEISFNCPMFPHLNEGDIISVTDKHFNLDRDTFIVNSITFDLGSLTTQMQVVNTQYLNTDIDISPDIITHEVYDRRTGIEYKITGGTGITPSSMILEPETEKFVTASGYDVNNHFDTFYKDGYEATLWINQYNGNSYPIGFEAYNPYFDSVLFPLWESTDDKLFKIVIKNCNSGVWNMWAINTAGKKEILESVKIGTRKYYFYGRGQNNYFLPIPTDGDLTLEHVFLGYSELTKDQYNFTIERIISILGECGHGGVNGGVGYSVKLPDVLSDYSRFINTSNLGGVTYTSFTLGRKAEQLGVKSFLTGASNLEEFYFNNENELTIKFNAQTSGSNESMLTVCPQLFYISAINKVVIERNLGTNELNFGGGSALPSMYFPNGISMNYVQFFIGCQTAASRRISLGIKTENADSVCSLYQSNALHGINAQNVDIAFNNLNLDQSGLFSGANMKSLTIDGYLILSSMPNKTSSFLVGATLQSGVLTIQGNTRINYGGTYFVSISILSQLTFIGKMTFGFSSLYNHSLTLITYCSDLTTINFNDLVEFDGGFSDKSVSFITSNQSLTRVNFYSKVDLNLGTDENSSALSGNPSLTDVYFYNEELTLPDTISAFTGNNEDFKIHGIANSSVQTIAESRGIPFVAITAEELAEAGL